MKAFDFRRAVEKKMNREEASRGRRVSAGKPGHTYYFLGGSYVGRRRNVAKWLPSSPIVDGVRMRYEKGRLVPRVSR